jgi:hypothetical protein
MNGHPTRKFKSGRDTARRHQASNQRLSSVIQNNCATTEPTVENIIDESFAPGTHESMESVISKAAISSRRNAFSGKLVERLIALLGQALNQGDHERTRQYAERLLHLCSSKARSFSAAGVYLAHFALTQCCHNKKDFQQALRHSSMACKIAQSDDQLMHVRGTTYRLKAITQFHLGKLVLAAESISTAIFYFGVERQEEELLASQAFLGTIYAAQNKLVEAELVLQPLVDLQRPLTQAQKSEARTWERNYEDICELLSYQNSFGFIQQNRDAKTGLA